MDGDGAAAVKPKRKKAVVRCPYCKATVGVPFKTDAPEEALSRAELPCCHRLADCTESGTILEDGVTLREAREAGIRISEASRVDSRTRRERSPLPRDNAPRRLHFVVKCPHCGERTGFYGSWKNGELQPRNAQEKEELQAMPCANCNGTMNILKTRGLVPEDVKRKRARKARKEATESDGKGFSVDSLPFVRSKADRAEADAKATVKAKKA